MANIYNSIAKPPKSLLGVDLNEYIPKLSEDDIDRGTIERYFVRQANHLVGEIVEIDKQSFERLKANALWQTVQLTWRIAGDLDDVLGPPNINSPVRTYTGVITANQMAIDEGNAVLPGLKYKLMNNTQYWIGR